MDRFAELCLLQYYAQVQKESVKGIGGAFSNLNIQNFREKMLNEISCYAKDADTLLRLKEQFKSGMLHTKDFQENAEHKLKLMEKLQKIYFEQS